MGSPQALNYYKDVLLILIILTLILIIFIPNDFMSINMPVILNKYNGHDSRCVRESKCDLSSGKWVRFPRAPYYTNKSECYMDIRQNCLKNERPDTDYLKWRWQPDQCELPIFDASEFLELVRGKSMAFIGDSVARNHMQSLGCLLSTASRYKNESDTHGEKFPSWYYPDYDFTLANFSSVHLIKSTGMSVKWWEGYMDLDLDIADKAWADHIEKFDYVIISAGHWFTKPLMFHSQGNIVGCSICNGTNVTELNQYYGYKIAFETTFNTLMNLNFKGKVFLRTMSPSHFEGGPTGMGFCPRTGPATKEETKFNWLFGSYYMIQKDELRLAKKKAKKKGLKIEFDIIDVTDAMMLRPDGHPNKYKPGIFDDCLHWCMPGPIDMWNEILFYKLKYGN